jgi:hypothetical protein
MCTLVLILGIVMPLMAHIKFLIHFRTFRIDSKHDDLETGSVSILRSEDTGSVIEVSFVQGTQLSRCLPPPHLRMETDPFSETSCFLVRRLPDD